MKIKFLICLYFINFYYVSLAQERSSIDLDSNWLYSFGDIKGGEITTLNTSQWSTLSLPHTWNAYDGQDGIKNKGAVTSRMSGDYARGTAWYRKTLLGALDWQGKQIYLQFDGANRRTDVFVNGSFVGTHIGGNARFRFDLTKIIHLGEPNLIAVRVNNESNDSIPHSADFTFCGGIYRNVSLVITDPLHIDTMDYASSGVYLKQTVVNDKEAQVDVTVKVVNHSVQARDAEVHVTICNALGNIIAEQSTLVYLSSNGKAIASLPFIIKDPHLWNGRIDPYLYKTHIEVIFKGKVTDSLDQPLGLRYFKVDPNIGFILNGKYLDLHGVSRHQDRINKGWAISIDDDQEDFGLIKEIGATAIRVAHYQQSQTWYDLADKTGIIMWSEVPFVDEAVSSTDFFNNALDQLRELIRQNYNHPAVCFWGCGNENSDITQAFIAGMGIYGPMAERLIQALHAEAKAEDPTRLTTYASYHTEEKYSFSIPGMASATYQGEPQRWYTDLTAFNKYFGWYYGEPSDSAMFLDSLHKRFPLQCIGISEYGAGAALTQHEDVDYSIMPRVAMNYRRANAFTKMHPEEYQGYYHEETWRAFNTRPYIWVKFVWNMFDFASDFRDEGDTPGRNDKGLVSYDRKTRKDAFYFYKSNWSSEPVLHITSSRFTKRTQKITTVKIYSNASEVELFINGTSYGKKEVVNGTTVWKEISLKSGVNTIHAEATIKGEMLQDNCQWILN